jgi:hypothetical protein
MDLILMAPVADGAEVADSFARLAYGRGVKYDDAANFGKEMGRKWQSKSSTRPTRRRGLVSR